MTLSFTTVAQGLRIELEHHNTDYAGGLPAIRAWRNKADIHRRLHGPYTAFDENGGLFEDGIYHQGKRIGHWCEQGQNAYYDQNGTPVSPDSPSFEQAMADVHPLIDQAEKDTQSAVRRILNEEKAQAERDGLSPLF